MKQKMLRGDRIAAERNHVTIATRLRGSKRRWQVY